MTPNSLESRVIAFPSSGQQNVFRPATCPMCHTPSSHTQGAIDAGGDWRCVRCGQQWDAERLAAVAAYAAWIGERDQTDHGPHAADDGKAVRSVQWSPGQSGGTT